MLPHSGPPPQGGGDYAFTQKFGFQLERGLIRFLVGFLEFLYLNHA